MDQTQLNDIETWSLGMTKNFKESSENLDSCWPSGSAGYLGDHRSRSFSSSRRKFKQAYMNALGLCNTRNPSINEGSETPALLLTAGIRCFPLLCYSSKCEGCLRDCRSRRHSSSRLQFKPGCGNSGTLRLTKGSDKFHPFCWPRG